jgi:hypothetical protein
MAEKQDKQDEKATGTVTKNVEVETTVDDPQAPREDTVARERSTSPVPRVGDTWESMDPRNEEEKGPQRRIGVLSVDGDQVHVENKSTRRKSHIALDSFKPPHWRFIG